MARFIDANARFKEAVTQDPGFAFAYLNVALTATSLDEFKRNLALAERLARPCGRPGNPFDPYIKDQLAVAKEGAGDAADAKKLFREVAEHNFNAVGFALVRKEAQQKAGEPAL